MLSPDHSRAMDTQRMAKQKCLEIESLILSSLIPWPEVDGDKLDSSRQICLATLKLLDDSMMTIAAALEGLGML